MNHDRIAELEQEIAEQEDLAARCRSEHRYVFDGRAQHLRAELSRLRNEQLEAVVTTCPGCGKPVTSYWHRDSTGCESRPEYNLIADAVFHTECLPSYAPSPEPQDVREALELQLFDLVELARDARSDKGGEAKWVHPRGALVKEFAKRIAALAQSDAEPSADAGLIEAAEWLSTAASRFEEAADALRSEYKTYARQMDRWAGDTRERARLFRIFSRAADRSVHGELIPDCPTEGVAARQGNGG